MVDMGASRLGILYILLIPTSLGVAIRLSFEFGTVILL